MPIKGSASGLEQANLQPTKIKGDQEDQNKRNNTIFFINKG